MILFIFFLYNEGKSQPSPLESQGRAPAEELVIHSGGGSCRSGSEDDPSGGEARGLWLVGSVPPRCAEGLPGSASCRSLWSGGDGAVTAPVPRPCSWQPPGVRPESLQPRSFGRVMLLWLCSQRRGLKTDPFPQGFDRLFRTKFRFEILQAEKRGVKPTGLLPLIKSFVYVLLQPQSH